MSFLTGFHSIEERIKSNRPCGPLLYAKAGPRAKEIIDLALRQGVKIERVGSFDLERISRENKGIALEVPESSGFEEAGLEVFLEESREKKNCVVVVLDEITDPYNFGAILRSCEQFGVDLVITRKRRAAKSADVIDKASAGAVNWAPQAQAANLPRALSLLKESGFWVYGADMKGESIFKTEFAGRCALVLGSEGRGISRLLAEKCDALVSIPSFGHIDSLNVSVACGVFLYEIRRQLARGAA